KAGSTFVPMSSVDWLRRLIAIRVTKDPKDEDIETEVTLRRPRWCHRRTGIDLWHADRCGGRDGQSSNEVRVWLLLCGVWRLAADDVPADQGRSARRQQAFRRNVRPSPAGEGGGRGGEQRREDDLRSGHQGTHSGHHAVRLEDRGHDADGRQGL